MVSNSNRVAPWQKVQEHLSDSAKAFYQTAYKSALQWYGEEDKAHRIAWSAVRSQSVSMNSVIDNHVSLIPN
jgi:cation transport regulator